MKRSSALQQSLPILVTSFINKSGSIGLSLLPMLLVERHVSASQGATIMSIVKTAMIVGTLLSGILSDRIGMKASVLIAFFITGVSFTLLPFVYSLVFLTLLGVTAQLGMVMTNQSVRLLLTQTVDRGNQKEALAWVRTVNNVGQIFSFGLAALTSSFGVLPLMFFDGVTSLLAGTVGIKKLPNRKAKKEIVEASEQLIPTPRHSQYRKWAAFIVFALLMGYWSFLYDLYITGIAGKLKLLFPSTGLKIFSESMLINTVLCAAFAIPASRFFRDTYRSCILAMLLTFAGFALSALYTSQLSAIYLGAFLITLGELAYGAVGQFTLVRLVPNEAKAGTHYAVGMTLVNVCRLTGAAFAFPWVVYEKAPHPWAIPILSVTVSLILLSFIFKRDLQVQ